MKLTLTKENKLGLLKARCEEDLERWYVHTAITQQIDVSDVVRMALRDFKQRNTKRYDRA